VWIAQTPAGGGSDQIVTFVQYGALGLVILALLAGWLWAKPAVQQLIKDKERAEQQRDELIKQMDQRIVPVLSEFTSSARTLAPLLEEVIRRLPDDRRTG
jgi:hypothetical protein